jgi:DNA polymerase I-like protein with 3'-5' exonuclease and polymerase domains
VIPLPDLKPGAWVACDTETSGLYVDDGARVSVVSIAWFEGGVLPEIDQFKYPQKDGSHLEPPYAPSQPLHSAVFAFDHGVDPPLGFKSDLPPAVQRRKKTRLQPSLLQEDEAPNLTPHDYVTLMEWLSVMRLVFHNAKFDLHILHQGLRTKESKRRLLPDLTDSTAWDTQIMCPVLWPDCPSGLKPTSERLFGVQEAEPQRRLKAWLSNHGYRFDLAPWDLLSPYAAQDAELTLRLKVVQDLAIREGELIPTPDLMEVAEREHDLCRTLTRMESRGVGWDLDGAIEQANRLAERAVDLRSKISSIIAGHVTQIAVSPEGISEDLMRRFWFTEEGLGRFPVSMTDKGKAQVTKSVVDSLAKEGVPAAEEWAELAKVENAVSMWYRGWSVLAGPPNPKWHREVPQGDRPARLRTSFNQGRTLGDGKGGTISGRLAVARFQAQAMPHDYQLPRFDPPLVTPRQLLRTDPGYVAVEIDLSQCEFRVAAAVADCKPMIDAFARGLDVHDETTRRMFKIDKDHPKWEFDRQVAKRCGLGMLYGAGVFTIGTQIETFTGISVAEEEIFAWVTEYKRTYPELVRKSRAVQRLAERNRIVRLAGGRVRWFGPGEEYHKAFNQLIQGSVGEMMKEAMVRVERQVPAALLLQVHDSLVLELPALTVGGHTKIAQSIICQTFEEEFGVPFRADAKIWATPDGLMPNWKGLL